ncbi:hypothetical protein HaLaN_03791 [Haematococcus lacustris]|uniref:Uncharacterized protein n=1 Tax=Haematococcus lacustris TaxID=44745 RepID=A0A699YH52_HAELA|nr:hypothetical protein HaLaN_03791 [Haematococcus lacustris]
MRCSRCASLAHPLPSHAYPLPAMPTPSQLNICSVALLPVRNGVMLCTDGWRHKHAAMGQPLVNLLLLKLSGGAIVQSVYTLDLGASRTKQFYVGDQGPSRAVARHHHGRPLRELDLSNESSTASKHTPVGVFLKQVQRISKVLSDGGKITHALHMAQQAKYNAIRHVASHCPTRFAILYKICVDIERSEDAFRMMVESGDWVHVAASCANPDVFEDMKTGM